ncbi:MAG: metal ABC transporter ATP-binding protein [Gemmatimonadetes bacterium]|nr:MAG: metal ABC transporter ATP-binding protein [Gemmatimonadota bacterium]
MTSALSSPPLSSAIAVNVNHLSVQFETHQALEDIHLQIESGSFVSILGPNGAGKSTFIRVLLGLISPSRGTITLFGQPLERIPPHWIGYIPQVKTLDRSFPALAVELVISGLRRQWPARIRPAERELAQHALAQVDAGHLVDRSLGKLSGGELQRVYLARTLIRKPRLIMLDEPATGIDLVGEADMYRLLETYQREHHATTLMITHDWEAAYHSSHVLLLNRRQIGFGPPQQVLTEECLRRAFGHTGHAHAMFWRMSTDA